MDTSIRLHGQGEKINECFEGARRSIAASQCMFGDNGKPYSSPRPPVCLRVAAVRRAGKFPLPVVRVHLLLSAKTPAVQRHFQLRVLHVVGRLWRHRRRPTKTDTKRCQRTRHTFGSAAGTTMAAATAAAAAAVAVVSRARNGNARAHSSKR